MSSHIVGQSCDAALAVFEEHKSFYQGFKKSTSSLLSLFPVFCERLWSIPQSDTPSSGGQVRLFQSLSMDTMKLKELQEGPKLFQNNISSRWVFSIDIEEPLEAISITVSNSS